MTKGRRWLEVALRAAEFRSVMAQHEMSLAEQAHASADGEMHQAKQTAKMWLSAWQGQRRSANFATDLAYQHITVHADGISEEKRATAEARETELGEAVTQLRSDHASQRALAEFAANAASQELQRDRTRQLSIETEAWMLGRLSKEQAC